MAPKSCFHHPERGSVDRVPGGMLNLLHLSIKDSESLVILELSKSPR